MTEQYDLLDNSKKKSSKNNQISLNQYAEMAYLNYSMYVILDRALPSICDGLKPVQRRIIYAMSELGLNHLAKHKKAARTVGDVLGKYHPHGETACYESMVLMAQSFSYRYPLIAGQGNWGAIDDPKSFAAMRYTEAKLSRYARILLNELGQGTVEWHDNFDGTLKEPSYLPARLPMILLNGASGIAVGMSTDIPPHNIKEVAASIIYLLDHPKAKLEEITQYIQGPDYCSQAEIITPRRDILDIYRTGKGTIKLRATYSTHASDAIIHALPYQVSATKVLEQIADQIQKKKLPMILDLRDESDHENPIRLIIKTKSKKTDIDALMLHLFATTDLEKNYRINFNMIGLDGRPQVKPLLSLLNEWIDYRQQTILKRTEFELNKVTTRLHLLEGFLITFLNLDKIIHIIRHEDEPKTILMNRFKLSKAQAEAILEIKLRQLAKLEEIKLRKELETLEKEKKKLEKIMKSTKQLNALMKKEILEDVNQFGDQRLSPLVKRDDAKNLPEKELLSNEPVTIILSQKGWIRSTKGHQQDLSRLTYKSDDALLGYAEGQSNQTAICMDSTGRTYCLATHLLPSARGYGTPLTGMVTTPSGAFFVGILLDNEDALYAVASNAGYGFIMRYQDMMTRNRTGKTTLSVSQGAASLMPKKILNPKNEIIAIASNEGRLLLFPTRELPMLSKGKGNKWINISKARFLSKEEFVIDFCILSSSDSLVIHSGQRHLTLNPTDLRYYQGERGQRGNKLPKGFQKPHSLTVLMPNE